MMFAFLNTYSQYEKLIGHWEGGIEMHNALQVLKVDFFEVGGKVHGNYTIPIQNYFNAPLNMDSVNFPSFNIEFEYGIFRVSYNAASDELYGLSKNSVANGEFIKLHLRKTGTKEYRIFTEEEVSFSNGDIKLAGTLFKPNVKGKYPVVILLAGSGPNDRKTPEFYSQAFKLANNGIGAFLFDKRGTGTSSGHWEQATIFDFAADGNAAVDYLAKRKDLPFSKIGLMGTSEGGWTAPIIANENENVSFAILNVGPAVSVYQQLMDFNKYWMKDKGVPQPSIDSINQFAAFYFKSLYDTTLKSHIPTLAYPIEHNKKWWADFLPAYDSAGIAWWTKNNYDPKKNLTNIKCPVLSILGTSDEFVPAQENETLMRRYLTQSGKLFKIKVFDNMEHSSLIDDKWVTDATGNKYWFWRRTVPGFFETIIEWIKEA